MSLQYQVLPNMTPEVIDEIKLQYPNLDLNTVQFVLSPDGQMNGQHLVIQEQMLNENEQMQVYQQSTGQHDGQQQIRITEQLQAPGTTQYYIQSDEINGEILNGIFYDQSQFHQVIDPQMIQQQQVFDTSTGSATTMQGDGIRQHQQQTQQIVIQHVQQSSEQPMIQVQSEQQQILVQQQQHQQQQQQQQQTLIQAQHYQQIHNQQQLHQIQQQSKQQQVVIHQQQQPQAQQQHQSSIPQQAATHQIIYETPKTHAVLASNQQIVQRAATTVTNRGRGGRGRGAVGGQGIITSASTFSAPRTQRPQFVRAPKPRAQKVNTTATATLIPRPRNPSVLSSQVNQNVDRFIPKLNDMPSQQIPQQSQQMPQQSQQQQSQTIQQQTTSTPIVKRTLPVTVTKRMVPLVVAKTAQSQQTSIVHSSFANAVSGDFEDSITAAKIAKQINTQRTVSIDSNSSGSSSVNNSSQSFGNNDHHHLLTATESPEDNHKVVTLTNGNTMTLAEYKRLRASQMPQFIPNNMAALRGGLVAPRGARGGRVLPTFVRKPVPQQQPQIYQTQLEVQQQHQSQQQQQHQQQQQQQHQHQTLISNNNASSLNIVSKAEQQNSAKMLVILKSGEQRLITFTLPKESCTVQELLEQVQVPFTNDTNILCYETPNSEINYTVTVGLTKEEADLQVYPKDRQQVKVEDSQKECALKQQQQRVMQVQQTLPHQQQRLSTIPVGLTAAQALQNQSIMASNIKKTVLNTINQELKEMPLPPMKRVEGMLAVCCGCGYTSVDHAKCERCKRIFTEAPKQIPLHAKLPALIATSSGTSSAPSTPAQSTSADNVDVRRRTIATDLLKTWNRKPAVVAAQLAGKSRVRKAKILEDPIVLTLSSDDESEPTKPKKIAKSLGNSDSHFEPFSFEPVIPKEDDTDLNLSRENVAETADDTLFTVVSCRTVRIGSFKFEPKHKVVFSSKGIRITAPSVKCSTDNVVLDIQTRELIKIVAHFPRSLCVLFIYTLPSCAQYIRDQLEMGSQHDPAGYFSSTSTDETQRRICLVLDGIADEARSVIKSIFPSTVLEEISQKDANDLLLRSSRDHAALAIGKKNACSSSSQIDYARSSNKEDDDEIRQVLIYPQGKGGISINTEDYACLAIDQYLNDVIIDFYLNYLLLEILTPDQRDKAHVFSSFFYKRLTTITTRQRNDKDPAASKMTASQKRHARVKNWTKNVNLFEKEFIIIPINEQSHWFLAIICFPGLKGPVTFDGNIPVKPEPIHKKKAHDSNKMTVPSLIGNTTITPVASRRELDAVFLQDDCSDRDEAEGDDSELGSDESDSEPTQPTPPKSQSKLPKEPRQPIKQPCILIFDSLAGASRSRVVATLRDYLTCEYRAKIATQTTSHAFNKLNLPGHCVKVPQQNNFTDCGLYLLQYVEHFFESPILDYRLPIKQLVNWFETIIVTRKREEISLLLHALVQKYDPANLPLPELALPTKDGELLERDDEDDDEDMDEAEFEEQSLDNYQFIKSETEKDSPDSSPDKQNNGRKKVLKRLLIKRESIGVKLNKNSNAAGDCGGESEKKRKQVETDGDEQTQRPVKKQAKSNTS